MHGFRSEYQDRVNFVILDYDERDERDFAGKMKAAQHPAYAVVPPNSRPSDAVLHRFGPQPEPQLRELMEEIVARFPAEPGS